MIEVESYEDVTILVDMIGQQLFEADFTPELRAEIPHLQEIHRQHFETQSNPVRSAWAPLAPSTIARKGARSGILGPHSTILVDTGRLFESLVHGDATDKDRVRDVVREPGRDFLTFGTSVPYSIFHDTGTSRMPARVHVGMNEDDLDKMAQRFADAAVRKMKQGA